MESAYTNDLRKLQADLTKNDRKQDPSQKPFKLPKNKSPQTLKNEARLITKRATESMLTTDFRIGKTKGIPVRNKPSTIKNKFEASDIQINKINVLTDQINDNYNNQRFSQTQARGSNLLLDEAKPPRGNLKEV